MEKHHTQVKQIVWVTRAICPSNYYTKNKIFINAHEVTNALKNLYKSIASKMFQTKSRRVAMNINYRKWSTVQWMRQLIINNLWLRAV
jgi:hypothetical protein